MDLVVSCDRFPGPGETRFGKSFATYSGGKGANQAVAAAKLGGNVTFLGRIGNDPFGDELVLRLGESGVGVDNLLRDVNSPTGVALITVDANGENEILVVPGSNMKLEPDDITAGRHLFERVSVLLLQLETPLPTVLRAAEVASESGVTVVLNPAPATKLSDEFLRLIDYLTPNELEIENLTGIPVRDLRSAEEAAHRLLARGVGNVIVTLGSTGAMMVSRQGMQLVRAPEVAAIDSTAAGDAFNGAFALALSWGWEAAEAMELAVLAASFSVTRVGAQPSLAGLSDLPTFVSPELISKIQQAART